MAELSENKTLRKVRIRHRGRGSQVLIFLGKQLRMFVYQNDWKVLPMAALIAGLVGMVIRKRFFINMEGTLMGSFAMVCVCIWNGCFNSIQVICRERDVIKREHRSGMHISSYIFSHMLYQALLCLAQTVVTINVIKLVGVQFPTEGIITGLFMVDFSISMFLISYASDMMSLWVSSLSHNTTTAMTIMPFVLIFQLVFSGGMLTLPEWTKTLTRFTISNPALKVIAAQADTNNRPYATISNMITKMRDNEIGGSVKVGQILDLLQNQENPAIAELRAREIGGTITLGELRKQLDSPSMDALKQAKITNDVTVEDVVRLILVSEDLESVRNYDFGIPGVTLGKLLQDIMSTDAAKPLLEKKLIQMATVGDLLNIIDANGLMEQYKDTEIGGTTTLGELIDMAANSPVVQSKRDTEIKIKVTVGTLIDLAGEERVKTFLEEKAAAASYVKDYEYELENIVDYWFDLIVFVLAFALLAMITLEFIDKDKR